MPNSLVIVCHLHELADYQLLLLDVVDLIDTLLAHHQLRYGCLDLQQPHVIIGLSRNPLFGWNHLC